MSGYPMSPDSTEIQSPALIKDHIQDRQVSKEIGAPMAWRRKDGIDYLAKRKLIARHQIEAANRLQEDYAISQREGGARSEGTKVNGGRRDYDIPQHAIDAKKRLDDALAILPPELLSMTCLFLLPHTATTGFSLEHISKRVGEDKRAISLGVRASLSLLARHYGSYRVER